MVPGAGIEPAQYEVPRDFKCRNGYFSKAGDFKLLLDFTGLLFYLLHWKMLGVLRKKRARRAQNRHTGHRHNF